MQHTSLHKSGDSLVSRYRREGPEKGFGEVGVDERFTVHESCVHKICEKYCKVRGYLNRWEPHQEDAAENGHKNARADEERSIYIGSVFHTRNALLLGGDTLSYYLPITGLPPSIGDQEEKVAVVQNKCLRVVAGA